MHVFPDVRPAGSKNGTIHVTQIELFILVKPDNVFSQGFRG